VKENWGMEKPTIRLHYDHCFVITVLLLAGVGIVTLYSASYAFAERFFHDRWYFIVRQAAFAALGLAAFFFVSWFPLEKIRRAVMPLVLLTIFLCALTFVPVIGVTKNGAVSRRRRLRRLPDTQGFLFTMVSPTIVIRLRLWPIL
jgi:cell division protein FtsW